MMLQRYVNVSKYCIRCMLIMVAVAGCTGTYHYLEAKEQDHFRSTVSSLLIVIYVVVVLFAKMTHQQQLDFVSRYADHDTCSSNDMLPKSWPYPRRMSSRPFRPLKPFKFSYFLCQEFQSKAGLQLSFPIGHLVPVEHSSICHYCRATD